MPGNDNDIGVLLIGCGRAGGIQVRSHLKIPGVAQPVIARNVATPARGNAGDSIRCRMTGEPDSAHG